MLSLTLTRRFWKTFSTTCLWKISMWPLYYHHILASVIRYYAINRWPQKMLWIIFCALVRPRTLEHHRPSKENVFVFLQFEYAQFSVYVHFFRFRPQIPFLGKFGPKNQNCQFIPKFGTWTNSNMQHSMFSMFDFSAFDWNYSFWANLVQIIKIVRLSWNLVPGLIRIRRI